MADNVPVTPSASYTVWAEDFASSGVIQRVKVVLGTTDADGGNIGTTNPMPISGTVSVSGAVQVSGAVSVSAMPAVSGTVTVIAPAVSTVVTVLGTVAVNVVAGGAAPGSTAATQSAITAQVVWLAPTQTITATVNTIAAGFSVQALVTGPVSISAMPAVSISAVVPVTTAASVSVTGLPVWLNPTQQVVVSGLVGQSITGSVNIVSVALVSISALIPVTTAASVSVTGLPVWLNPTQQIVVSGLVGHSITGSVNIVSVALVSISAVVPVTTAASVSVTGVPVWLNPTQTIAVSGLNFTTATPTVTATGPIVWLANTVTVTVTATVTGSLIISGIAVVTTAASVSVSGLPVWLNPTQGVVASVSAFAASLVLGTIIAVSGITAMSALSTVVTILGTQIVTLAGSPGFNAVHIEITSTAIAQSAAIYLFTIWTGVTGAPVAAGTTAFAIPAGKTLRFLNMQGIINSSAVTGGTVNIIALGVGATGSLVSASVSTQLQVMKLQVLVSAGPIAASIAGFQDVGPGVSIGMIIVASTAAQLQQMVIHGYLF